MRRLAERTKPATENIKGTITAIQNESQEALKLKSGRSSVAAGITEGENARHTLDALITLANRSGKQIGMIAAAATERAAASQEISQALASICEASRSVSSASDETTQSSLGLTRLAAELECVVKSFRLAGSDLAARGQGPEVSAHPDSIIPIQLAVPERESKVPNAHTAFTSATLRRLPQAMIILLFLLTLAAGLPLAAQDDITTQNATSAYNGAYITGPASNPLSFLNGPAFRTTGNPAPYDFHDFAPLTGLDAKLPKWANLEAEERFRYEAYDNNNFKANADDSYLLNRFRFQVDLHAASWLRVTAQVQDARAGFQNPPLGPPNTVRWDLKEAYAEIGAPEQHWFSLRVGRQLISYNNTIMSNSEWRNQGRSYDAAVLNLNAKREHLGIFAASAVVPQGYGVSPHKEGNNIYGAYGRVDDFLVPHSNLEPFILWRVQPAEVVEAAVAKTTGHENEKAFGVRLKAQAHTVLDYSGETIVETGTVGSQPIRAWAAQAGVAYQFLDVMAKPRVFAQYDYASGNSNPAQNASHTTFDTIYPSAHDRFGITDLFGWQNLETVHAGATVEPHRRLTFTVQGLDDWAAEALDSIYNTSGSAIVNNKTNHGRHVGAEIDSYSWYELNAHFNLGGGIGYFGGGQFLTNVTTNHSYTTYYVALNFKDSGKK